MHPVIIVAAYSRDKSLSRLLTSLKLARYPKDVDIKVIISLDGGYAPKVSDVAEQFKRDFDCGEVEIIRRDKNIGLRKHIIWCGNQTEKYGSVIVLEDDLIVDPHFYYYTVQALEFYAEDDQLAGISLYAQRYNEYAGLPFEPMCNLSTGYFMQVACSWGEAWTRKQWGKFIVWYNEATEESVTACLQLPETVKKWPETSWKKYFSAYMAYHNVYFFYPYNSYVTNCSDAGGTHVENGSRLFQVPLAIFDRPLEHFRFEHSIDGSVFYDSFMESASPEIFKFLGLSPTELEIDLYGIKPIELVSNKKYTITSKKVEKYCRVFLLGLRPIEKVVVNEVFDFNQAQGGAGDVYLTYSSEVNNVRKPYMKIASYLSYFSVDSKRFALGLISVLVVKFFNKFK